MGSELIFYVNGRRVVEKNPEPEMTLLIYLRTHLHLTGTKLGCGEGGCGACTVMISKCDRKKGKILHFSVNACLYPLCSVHGQAVTTVEGIGSIAKGIHPVQERIAKSHGSQCGFCTPGIVMSMYTLLRNNPEPSCEEMEHYFDGNLCRCTGYRPILDGFRTFTKGCAMGKNCCRNQKNGDIPQENGVNGGYNSELVDVNTFKPFEPSQEPIFPPELQLSSKFDETYLQFNGERCKWYRPVALSDLLSLKAQYPKACLVNGNSEIGVEMKLQSKLFPVMISSLLVPELNEISWSHRGVCFGASVTLSQIEDTLKEAVCNNEEYKTRGFGAILEILRWFAGHQIRNVAAVAGNIMTASPISDLNPIFLTAGVVLTVASKDGGYRDIKMDQKFFVSYRKTVVKPDEFVICIHIPFTRKGEFFSAYKQSHRRDDDIAIVNAAMRVLFKEEGRDVVEEMALSFGGMAPTTVMATKTMKIAKGRHWNETLLTDVCKSLAEDMPISAGVPGGMAEYRSTLTTSFFFKFYLTVTEHLHKKMPPRSQSATPVFHREPTRSLQLFEERSDEQGQDSRCQPHVSAIKQATGEALYVDDLPYYTDELYLAMVRSTKAHGKILNVDYSDALSMPGVVDYVTAADIKGENLWGPIKQDEEILASKKVVYQGQPLGAILADSQLHAQRAAKAVKVTYEELDPVITIKDAIEANSFLQTLSHQKGDVNQGFNEADMIHHGEMHVGGQEHFYLETQASLVIPFNGEGEVTVISSTQHVTEGQHVVAAALGVDSNKVVCKTKRLGGGFGGKESRATHLATICAIGAVKSGRPVRCMFDRDEDMLSTGTRHPFLGKYKVGYKKTGHLTALEIELYANAGHSFDLSPSVIERAMLHITNCYHIPHIHITRKLCRTNIPSNTAFRGFGAPQGMLICENYMTEIANNLELPQEEVRRVNMLRENDMTFYYQPLINFHLTTCWDECLRQSHFSERRKKVTDFNSANRWKKKGIAVIPTQFGIAFTTAFLNQGGALIQVYTDGSVLLTHGGVEMGQGLHTKMIQVASRTLSIPVSKISISETSTDKVPNSSPTAASMGSDINGMAIMNACNKILQRLLPYKSKKSWEEKIKAAYFDRVSLSATGFCKIPGLESDDQNNIADKFSYFTTGVACSEVEIDCLTGDHQVLRTDIVMDIGRSLNPAIDIGQIEGAFTQGYGLMMMEQQKIRPSGTMLTRGPGSYKIPSFGDIPVELNVTLLKGVSNPKAVYSSRALGEPPLFLAASVFFAVKDAIMAARAETGNHGNFKLQSPATPDRIRMACVDQFTEQFPMAEDGSYTPWFVDL